MNDAVLRQSLLDGPYPSDDGWGSFYGFFQRVIRPARPLRAALCAYLWPRRIEQAGNGRLFRALGVHLFGRVIPTGGVLIRRITGSRMAPYTLKGTSQRAARAFFYRACIFEMLHFPFFAALAALSIHRLSIGRADLALENTILNLAVNLYPMLHHRHTRVRILSLLRRAARR